MLVSLHHLNDGLKVFATDVLSGFLSLTRNSLAAVGLVVFVVVVVYFTRPDLQVTVHAQLLSWIQERQPDTTPPPDSVGSTANADPEVLTKQQANLALWISRKYKVGMEPIGAVVAEAFELGQKLKIDPTLILAVVAIESGFNPYAQSHMGAQGLMQVMTRVHTEKYEVLGGVQNAFDPIINVQVGSQILHDYIERAGSTEGGLKLYLGAVDSSADGYIDKVRNEHQLLLRVKNGGNIPTSSPSTGAAAAQKLGSLWDKAQRIIHTEEPGQQPSQPLAPAAAE